MARHLSYPLIEYKQSFNAETISKKSWVMLEDGRVAIRCRTRRRLCGRIMLYEGPARHLDFPICLICPSCGYHFFARLHPVNLSSKGVS